MKWVIAIRETWKTHLYKATDKRENDKSNYSVKQRAKSSSLAFIKQSSNEIRQYRNLLPKNIAELKHLFKLIIMIFHTDKY